MKTATALHYDGEGAPKATAQGRQEEALALLADAQKQGIPILQHPQLANALDPVGVGEEIPEALYLIVAEILVLAYKLEGKEDPRGSPVDKSSRRPM
ncbi:MAG: EscU/YscU/HrcU family type III secretion system export apparatus switch protein [Litorivicinus sp.]